MKNILLATAAAAALLFAPVMASAQYAPAQPTAPITTPAGPRTSPDDAATAQPSATETAPAAPTTVTGQSSVTTPATTAQSSTYAAQTAQTTQAPNPSLAAQSNAPAYGSTATPGSMSSYQTAAATTSTGVRGQLISDTKALELAQDAGMQAVPMSAAAVCQPRSLDLAGGATHDNRNQLEFAVDRASVCELQEIALPARGAASFRQALIRQGVDASKIVEGEGGSTEARMTFAGVATSGGQYAALYNPVRTAANTQNYAPAQSPNASDASPSYAPAPSTTAPNVAPSTAPAAPAPDHSSMDHDMSQPNQTPPADPTL
jgi:hypothetical protein